MRGPIFAAVAIGLLFLAIAPALAKWPTTDWIVLEQAEEKDWQWDSNLNQFIQVVVKQDPEGERRRIAGYYADMLEQASRWYESLGFPAPRQATVAGNSEQNIRNAAGDDYLAFLKTDTTDVGSSHDANAFMSLSTYPAYFNPPLKPWYKVMRYAPVHELYHAIQGSHEAYSAYTGTQPTGPARCDNAARADQWLTEGTAAYVQLRWIERIKGIKYGHLFKGSPRKAWLRYFDQPLHWGSLPPDVREDHGLDDGHGGVNSWYCSYGTWYFWYAVGEMLQGRGSLAERQRHRVTYLQYIFSQAGPWKGSGLAMVDAGLRKAAQAFDVIRPYREGLYDLYPQFVAQYLDDDQFYQRLHEVELSTPGMYETESAAGAPPGSPAGLLQPLASRAWRVRVLVPGSEDVRQLYTVRFTLDAKPGTDREDLHLIVDRRVVQRPASRDTAYTLEKTVDVVSADPSTVEFLVRVANVARDVNAMHPAGFRLKIEVEGYYGDKQSVAPMHQADDFDPETDVEAIVGALPPGFAIQGPGPYWRCTGGTKARARFALMTPDATADAVAKMAPEAMQSMTGGFDSAMIKMEQMRRMGMLPDSIDLAALRAAAQRAQKKLEQYRPMLEQRSAEAAAKTRARRETTLTATLVGMNGDAECQLTIGATWPGAAGGNRVVPEASEDGGTFSAGVYPAQVLKFMRNPLQAMGNSLAELRQLRTLGQDRRWKSCRVMSGQCANVQCNPGELRLKAASKDHIAGSFRFDVVKVPTDPDRSCPRQVTRATVTGHFNVYTSIEDTGTVLDALLPGRTSGGLPGAPILTGE